MCSGCRHWLPSATKGFGTCGVLRVDRVLLPNPDRMMAIVTCEPSDTFATAHDYVCEKFSAR